MDSLSLYPLQPIANTHTHTTISHYDPQAAHFLMEALIVPQIYILEVTADYCFIYFSNDATPMAEERFTGKIFGVIPLYFVRD